MIWKLAGLSISLAVAAVWADVEHRETKQFTFTLPAAGKLIVDNLSGGIRVSSHARREVRVSVEEHWTAETQEELAKARQAVKLDATQDVNTVRIYVDGPFRCNCNNERRYSVRHQFEIAVPLDTSF